METNAPAIAIENASWPVLSRPRWTDSHVHQRYLPQPTPALAQFALIRLSFRSAGTDQTVSESPQNSFDYRWYPNDWVPAAEVVGKFRSLQPISNRTARLRLPGMREKRGLIPRNQVSRWLYFHNSFALMRNFFSCDFYEEFHPTPTLHRRTATLRRSCRIPPTALSTVLLGCWIVSQWWILQTSGEHRGINGEKLYERLRCVYADPRKAICWCGPQRIKRENPLKCLYLFLQGSGEDTEIVEHRLAGGCGVEQRKRNQFGLHAEASDGSRDVKSSWEFAESPKNEAVAWNKL